MFKKSQTETSAAKFMTITTILFFIFTVFTVSIFPLIFKDVKNEHANDNEYSSEAVLYLNEDYIASDPLLSAVPKLEDILRGPIITDSDPALGSAAAPVIITMYSNFGCSFCHSVLNTVKEVYTKMSADLRIIHKDFPNSNKSYATYQAAIVGRCAQAQGKFWEMAERLYQNFNNLKQNTYDTAAQELGMNLTKFNNCMNGQTGTQTTRLIDDNIAEANALAIIGIPLIYINDQEILGDITVPELTELVQKELKKLVDL